MNTAAVPASGAVCGGERESWAWFQARKAGEVVNPSPDPSSSRLILAFSRTDETQAPACLPVTPIDRPAIIQ
jgi:hypothetical protein